MTAEPDHKNTQSHPGIHDHQAMDDHIMVDHSADDHQKHATASNHSLSEQAPERHLEIETTAHADHNAHAMHVDHTGHEQMFRDKFWLSLILSIPVLFYSMGLQMMLGISLPAFPGSQWLAPVFSFIVFLVGGVPFLQMAIPELKNRQPGMMTLISLAISVAFIYSFATLFLPGQVDFFWELVTLIDIMLLGHWIEMRSVRQASGALDALAKLMPDTAERILPDGSLEIVPVSRLNNGDHVLVRPGSSIPVDGVVIEGEFTGQRGYDHRRIETSRKKPWIDCNRRIDQRRREPAPASDSYRRSNRIGGHHAAGPTSTTIQEPHPGACRPGCRLAFLHRVKRSVDNRPGLDDRNRL